MPTLTAAQIGAQIGRGITHSLTTAGLSIDTTSQPVEVFLPGRGDPPTYVTYSGGASGTIAPGTRVTFAAGLTVSLLPTRSTGAQAGTTSGEALVALTAVPYVPPAAPLNAVVLSAEHPTLDVDLNRTTMFLDTRLGAVKVSMSSGSPTHTVSYWDTDSTGTTIGTIYTLGFNQSVTIAANKFTAFSPPGGEIPHLGFRLA